ncbi:MAG: nitrogen fixation sigma-54 dependent transcriptional regulator GnfM [Desulfuromonadia bacterium]
MGIERILVADDEESIRWVLARALRKKGFAVDLARDGEEALRLVKGEPYDLAIIDIRMPKIDGLELLDRIRKEREELLVVVMTAETTMKNAVESMKRGAYDYVTKPFDLEAIDAIIEKATRAKSVYREVTGLREELKGKYGIEKTIIGSSPAMAEIYKIIGKVAASDMTVLIQGESGTGKELVARAIHFNSTRLGKPFVAINCAAIPKELLESELFGHEKGAFTGATDRMAGKFEQADGGTIFLDEIGDMPLDLQAKILRVLQEREIVRTGGSRTIPVNVRVIAATNQNLARLVEERRFREDLYYRLNVVPITLPPLRDRQGDIPVLVEYFVARACQELGVATKQVTPEALSFLASLPWPGNVRELENVVRRGVILSSDPILNQDDFQQTPSPRGGRDEGRDASLEELVDRKIRSCFDQIENMGCTDLYRMVIQQVERPLIRFVLEKCRNNQIKAAEILGINRNTVRKKIAELGIVLRRNGQKGGES